MKKLAVLLLLLIGTSCFASQSLELQLERDYLLTSDINIKSVQTDDEDIVTISPFFTISNEKKVWLLHPRGIGKTKFSIVSADNSNNVFDLSVTPFNKKNTFRTYQRGEFEIMLLDKPPILKKPDDKGGK